MFTGISSMISFTPYMVLLIGLTVFCSLSAVVIMGAVRAQTLFGTASPCFRTQRNSPSIKQDLSALDQAIRFDIVDEDEKNPDVIPSTKGRRIFLCLCASLDEIYCFFFSLINEQTDTKMVESWSVFVYFWEWSRIASCRLLNSRNLWKIIFCLVSVIAFFFLPLIFLSSSSIHSRYDIFIVHLPFFFSISF